MRYQVTVERDYLSIEVGSGEGRQRAVALLNAISVLVLQSTVRPALISAMDKKPLSLTDLYSLARSISRTPLRDHRVAFLYDADESFESSRFIESIAEENGLKLAVFRTTAEAVAWLARHETVRTGTGRERGQSHTFGYRL
jgi:hypothetical protein